MTRLDIVMVIPFPEVPSIIQGGVQASGYGLSPVGPLGAPAMTAHR